MKQYFSSKMFSDPDFPVTVTRLRQRSQMTPHTHDFIEFVLVAEGHTIHRVQVNGEHLSYGLIQGDCFTILPGEVHEYSESKNLVLYNVAFKEEILQSELAELKKLPLWNRLFETKSSPVSKRLHLLPHERMRVESFLRKMMLEFSYRRPGYKFRVKLALLETLCAVDEANIVEWQPYDTEPYSGLLKTLDYLEKVESEPFNLKDLARMAGMSVSSYTKKFRDMIGDSPCEYFLGIKLEKIRSELIRSDSSVSELAFKYGFCDTSYMIKLFRRRHGMTPTRYRNIILSKR